MQTNNYPSNPLEFLIGIFGDNIPDNSAVAITGFSGDPKYQKDWSPRLADEQSVKSLLKPENKVFQHLNIIP